MSDPASEPGAPAAGAAKQPSATSKGVAAHNNDNRSPISAFARLLSDPDRLILHINKLIATPGGLSSFLSTFNYALYLIAFLETKSDVIRAKLNELLGRVGTASKTAAAGPPTPPRAAILASLISSARTTYRLLGLFPIYGWMRQLLQGPKPGQDHVLYTTALTQCTLYGTFQLLENIAVLIDAGVLSKSAMARWNPSGDTARIKLWSYRAWFGGVLCDFVRLGREAQIERVKRAKRPIAESKSQAVREADRATDVKWWLEALVPVGWTPLALHCSLEGGLPGFNLLIMGLSGFTAGLPRTAALWKQTAA